MYTGPRNFEHAGAPPLAPQVAACIPQVGHPSAEAAVLAPKLQSSLLAGHRAAADAPSSHLRTQRKRPNVGIADSEASRRPRRDRGPN
jgi:hypothetical protein